MDTAEPFWCEELGKYLKIIPNEEANKVCKDVQLYYNFPRIGPEWTVDRSDYMDSGVMLPSSYERALHAIEVHLDKPEYEPEQRSCDHEVRP